MSSTKHQETDKLKFLRRLSYEFPTVDAASSKIIRLSAIEMLPKGTEHFISDIHGEYEAFTHILNNASGVVREKVDASLDGLLNAKERAAFATLIYYPRQKLQEVKRSGVDMVNYYHETLYHLVEVAQLLASKYTRKFVRDRMPAGYEYLLDELLHVHSENENKNHYYERIINSIIENEQADNYIDAMSTLIKRLAVHKLHIVGDVFDRGPRADIILDKLMEHHAVDWQFGNHDVLWMGAAAGSDICIANVLNVSVSYDNMEVLEDGYGINLRPLALFAEKVYADDACVAFAPKAMASHRFQPQEVERVSKMYKAISVILFKLECQVIDRNPDFKMEHRGLLRKVNPETQTVEIGGKHYPMKDCAFPTVDWKDPAKLTEEEHEVVLGLCHSFTQSEKLGRHIEFLYDIGSMYHIENENLLFHGALPMNADGSFAEVEFEGQTYQGVELFDYCDKMSRLAYFAPIGSPRRQRGMDFMWYLWCGPKSPVFGRAQMTTFERLYIEDKDTHKEEKDEYYNHYESEDTVKKILASFGVHPEYGHIINGHVPVRVSKGENPIKANGRLIVIDGGFSKAYQKQTGIAGYTLIYSSRGLSLRSHGPFESMQKAVRENEDIISTKYVFEASEHRLYIRDTDTGAAIRREIGELKDLIAAYDSGELDEARPVKG